MKLLSLQLSAIFLLLALSAPGQQFSVSNSIRDLNLPTQEIYRVIQDKKGYLWFATEFGLYRYQQGRTKPIQAKSAATNTAILSACETADGAIVCATISGKIFAVQKDSLTELDCSRKGFLHYENELIYQLREDDQRYLWVNTSTGSYRISPDRSTVETIEPPETGAFPLIKVQDQLQPVNRYFFHHVEHFEDKQRPLTVSFPGLREEKVTIPKMFSGIDQFRILTAKWRGLHAVTYGRTLLLVPVKGEIRKISVPAHVISLKTDPDGGLWIGFYKHGYYYFEDISSLDNPIKGLTDVSVSDICVDKEGGLWITSLERGVFYGPGTFLLQHTYDRDAPTPYKSLYASEDGILAASYGQPTIMIYDQAGAKPGRIHKPPIIETMVGYIETKKQRYFFDHTNLIIQDRITGRTMNTYSHNEVFNSVFQFGENKFLIFTPSSTLLYQGGITTKLPRTPERIFHSLGINGSGLLAGGRTSLYFAADTFSPSFSRVPGDNGRVVQLMKTSAGNSYALIQNKGLAIFQNDSLKIILPSLTSEMYYGCTEANGRIWIASNNGVWAYNENDLLSAKEKMPDPVTDHIVYSFAKTNDRMYMAASTGIISMPFDPVEKNKASFPVYLASWSVGDDTLSITDRFSDTTFDYNTGALTWAFDVVSFHTQPANLYYLLTGPQSDSGLISDHQLQLGNLRPGKYQLSVWATRNDGASSNIIAQSFRISPPYWQKRWFIALVFAFAILATAGLTWLIIRRIRHREQQKRKMENELLSIRLQALQAQMNPHFVFNAINSIQLFILQHQEQEAYHYLTQFSKLIRRVLTQSRSPLIALKDELETLQLYVELEQLRFPGEFQYTVEAGLSKTPDQFYLPVMLLQPAIENAILHGIGSNGLQGKIALRIVHSPTDKIISFSISDNGTGRLQTVAKHPSSTEHAPVSSVINAERIETLNKIYDTDKFSLTIQISSDENRSAGTTVTISIPDNLNMHA